LKKPSAQSSSSSPAPPDPPVFFVDRSLGGKVVPGRLREAGWRVERHDDHFAADTPDPQWIVGVGKRGWIILTADERIRYNPLEKAAYLNSGTLIFLLANRKSMTGVEMADAFVAAETSILNAIARQRPPAIFKVSVSERRAELWISGNN
jgi:hypothetical protein